MNLAKRFRSLGGLLERVGIITFGTAGQLCLVLVQSEGPVKPDNVEGPAPVTKTDHWLLAVKPECDYIHISRDHIRNPRLDAGPINCLKSKAVSVCLPELCPCQFAEFTQADSKGGPFVFGALGDAVLPVDVPQGEFWREPFRVFGFSLGDHHPLPGTRRMCELNSLMHLSGENRSTGASSRGR